MSTFDLSNAPGAFLAHKRPIPVAVVFAKEYGVLETREGPVRFQAGDALLTGVEGERWPVPRERFLVTYSPLPPTHDGEAGRYVKRPLSVWAWKTNQSMAIPLTDGRGLLQAEPGDVIVQYGPGDLAVVAALIFDKTYEPDP